MNTKYVTQILLIEAEPGDTEMIARYLVDAAVKYDLLQVVNLADGLEMLQTRHIDLVILDINLPDSSGFKTISTFLDAAPDTTVIAISGINNEIIGNQAIKAGVQDFLFKDQFDAKLLGRVVRYSLMRGKSQNRMAGNTRDLEIARRRFLEAQELARFGSWELDLVSGDMKWTDEVFRIFNRAPASLSPSLSDYISEVHYDDKATVEAFFENAAKDGKLRQIEYRVLLENLTIRHVAVYAKIQYEEQEEKLILVGGIQDVTERKISEKLLIEKSISSETARMQDEVLSELSFQIKTPLSSIVNLLFLLENTNLNANQDGFINDMKTSVDDLSLAVNNLLNFSVMVSDSVKVEEEEFNIRDFVQSAVKVIKIKADNAKLSLDNIVDEKMPEKIISDPKKLNQILYNLLDNAIKYTPEGGKILLSASLLSSEDSDTLEVMFTVKDSGIGMKAAKVKLLKEADKMLETSNSKEEQGKKRPLGVAIVVKLAKTLGGSIEIESQEESGSVFSVKVKARKARQAKFRIGHAPDMPLRILLVEDHFLNQIATKKVLTSWSDYVTVDIAENGAIALEKFQETSYDIVLMDIQMPVMNGQDATRHLRKISDVPIIALTANSSRQEEEKCLELGMNDYLAKPFKPQDLYLRIMSLMSMIVN